MSQNNIAGLGRFDTTKSAAGDEYLKLIQQSGKDISQLGSGYAAVQSEIGRRKGVAASMVPSANFTEDRTVSDLFGSKAQAFRSKIDGSAEDSYDFSTSADVARFKADLASLSNSIKEYSPLYTEAVANFQDLAEENFTWSQTQFDPNQAQTKTIDGVEVYNTKAGGDQFKNTMLKADRLRNSIAVPVDGGGFQLVDTNMQPVVDPFTGKTMRTFNSENDILKELITLGEPAYAPVPIISGADLVKKKKWYQDSYPTREQALSAFTRYVKEHPLETNRAFAEDNDMKINDVPTEIDDSGLTTPQKSYLDGMIGEWDDRYNKTVSNGNGDTTASTRTKIYDRGVAKDNVVTTLQIIPEYTFRDASVSITEPDILAEDVVQISTGELEGTMTLMGEFSRPSTLEERVAFGGIETIVENSVATAPTAIFVTKDGDIIVNGQETTRITAAGAGTGATTPALRIFRADSPELQQNRSIIDAYLRTRTGEGLDYFIDKARGEANQGGATTFDPNNY